MLSVSAKKVKKKISCLCTFNVKWTTSSLINSHSRQKATEPYALWQSGVFSDKAVSSPKKPHPHWHMQTHPFRQSRVLSEKAASTPTHADTSFPTKCVLSDRAASSATKPSPPRQSGVFWQSRVFPTKPHPHWQSYILFVKAIFDKRVSSLTQALADKAVIWRVIIVLSLKIWMGKLPEPHRKATAWISRMQRLDTIIISYLAGMSPYISLKIKKRHYEYHMIETHIQLST